MQIREIPHYFRVVWRHRVLPLAWRYGIALRDPLPGNQDLYRLFPRLDREEFAAEFSESIAPRLPFDMQTETELLREEMLQIFSAEEIVKQATAVRLHRFQLLEESERHLGGEIAWRRDYKSGVDWPQRPAHDFPLTQPGADVKYPWELSRCQWLNWLGMAYLLDESPEWARTYENLLSDWIKQNPVGIGVNWRMPMEVAIRAINWIYGWAFFAEAFEVSDEFRMSMLRMLLAHGSFLEYNLEYTRHPGNHLDANLAGLMALGVFFDDCKVGKRWQRKARAMLEREIRRQVYEDGVNYEKSSGYHRLVMECFTVALAFGRRGGIDFSLEYHERLASMARFCAAYTRPDGSTPNFGDMDNGRILRFRADEDFLYHGDNLHDTAQLLAQPQLAASVPKQSPDLLFAGGAQSGEFADSSEANLNNAPADVEALQYFRRGGYLVHRSATHHFMIDLGDYGMDGWGGHGHNDCLAFTLWLLGTELFCDSGTGVYTQDPALRNRLRGTQAHNTVAAGELEQVEFGGLWRIKQDGTNVKVVNLEGNPASLDLSAEHSGYLARRGFKHSRSVALCKFDKGGELTISDSIEGTDPGDARAWYHLHPDLIFSAAGEGVLECTLAQGRARIEAGQPIHLLDAPWSPAYGVVKQHKVFSLACPATLRLSWELTV